MDYKSVGYPTTGEFKGWYILFSSSQGRSLKIKKTNVSKGPMTARSFLPTVIAWSTVEVSWILYFVTWATRLVPNLEPNLLFLPEHLRSLQVFYEVHVAQSLVSVLWCVYSDMSFSCLPMALWASIRFMNLNVNLVPLASLLLVLYTGIAFCHTLCFQYDNFALYHDWICFMFNRKCTAIW